MQKCYRPPTEYTVDIQQTQSNPNPNPKGGYESNPNPNPNPNPKGGYESNPNPNPNPNPKRGYGAAIHTLRSTITKCHNRKGEQKWRPLRPLR